MREIRLSRAILGKEIQVLALVLDSGLAVIITGGKKSHIGAFSRRAQGETPLDVTFPTHREGCICEKWAQKLFEKTGEPVCVECGIHYDGINAEGIEAVLGCCDALLDELLFCL